MPQENKDITVEDVRRLLKKTDWAEYNRRVVSRVAKKAEDYKKANAKSREEAVRQVFV